MNAPATFQRMLDILLSGYRWKSCLIYLDDIIIFSKDYDTHLKDVDVILRALQQERLSLNLNKCKSFTTLSSTWATSFDGANSKFTRRMSKRCQKRLPHGRRPSCARSWECVMTTDVSSINSSG